MREAVKVIPEICVLYVAVVVATLGGNPSKRKQQAHSGMVVARFIYRIANKPNLFDGIKKDIV